MLLIPMSRALEICLATVPVAPEREREEEEAKGEVVGEVDEEVEGRSRG